MEFTNDSKSPFIHNFAVDKATKINRPQISQIELVGIETLKWLSEIKKKIKRAHFPSFGTFYNLSIQKRLVPKGMQKKFLALCEALETHRIARNIQYSSTEILNDLNIDRRQNALKIIGGIVSKNFTDLVFSTELKADFNLKTIGKNTVINPIVGAFTKFCSAMKPTHEAVKR
jgi:hypothetical protein